MQVPPLFIEDNLLCMAGELYSFNDGLMGPLGAPAEGTRAQVELNLLALGKVFSSEGGEGEGAKEFGGHLLPRDKAALEF